MSTPETCDTLDDVAKYKQQSLNSLVTSYAELPLDKLVILCIRNSYTKQEISDAIKEYINDNN